MTTAAQFAVLLDEQHLNACQEAREWVAQGNGGKGLSLKQAWQSCHRGDWLLWLAGRVGVDRRALGLAACDCAETASPHWTADIELACIWAIDAARRWARGETDLEEVEAAAWAAEAAAAAAAVRNAAMAERAQQVMNLRKVLTAVRDGEGEKGEKT